MPSRSLLSFDPGIFPGVVFAAELVCQAAQFHGDGVMASRDTASTRSREIPKRLGSSSSSASSRSNSSTPLKPRPAASGANCSRASGDAKSRSSLAVRGTSRQSPCSAGRATTFTFCFCCLLEVQVERIQVVGPTGVFGGAALVGVGKKRGERGSRRMIKTASDLPHEKQHRAARCKYATGHDRTRFAPHAFGHRLLELVERCELVLARKTLVTRVSMVHHSPQQPGEPAVGCFVSDAQVGRDRGHLPLDIFEAAIPSIRHLTHLPRRLQHHAALSTTLSNGSPRTKRRTFSSNTARCRSAMRGETPATWGVISTCSIRQSG